MNKNLPTTPAQTGLVCLLIKVLSVAKLPPSLVQNINKPSEVFDDFKWLHSAQSGGCQDSSGFRNKK